jgi:membrane fusion protein, multidrug efflux system
VRALAAMLVLGLAVAARAQEESSGYIQPARVIKVSAPEPGVVLKVLVAEGQKVKAGESLVRLDTRVLEQEAAIAEEQAKVLIRRLEKLKKLLALRYASQDEVARMESELEITRLRKKRAEAQMERLTLRSPIDGIVTEVRYDEAESVPGPNEHVVTVVQLEPMTVEFNMPVAQATKLREGSAVSVNFPDLNVSLPGKVRFVSPVATAVVNTVRVTVVVPDAARKGIPSGSKCILANDFTVEEKEP